jgi:DNA-binding MarR family transcriptional regulator
MKLLGIIDRTPIRFAYRLTFLSSFHREPLLRRIEREHGIIGPEWTVLFCLSYRDGLNPRDICEISELPRNTISRGVASLERKGLIRTSADREDGRRRLLFLTDDGRTTHAAIMPLFAEREAAMLRCLSADERVVLDGLLDKMCRDVPSWSR